MTTSQRRGLAAALIAAIVLGIFLYLRRGEKQRSTAATGPSTEPAEFDFDPNARPRRVTATVGELRPYKVELTNRTIVDTGAAVGMEGASDQTIEVSLGGAWLLKTLPAEGEDVLVQAQFFPSRFALTNSDTVIPSSDLEPARRALNSSVVIRYGVDGRVKGIRVPPQLDTDPDTFSMLKMIIASLQIVYGDDGAEAKEWEVLEEDGSGALRARYRWEQTGVLRKSKLAYENQPIGDSPTIGDGIDLSSNLDSTFRMVRNGWIGSLAFDEQVSMKLEGAMGTEAGRDFSMFTNTRIDARLLAAAPQAIANLPEEWSRWPERPLADPTMSDRRRFELDPDFQLALTMKIPDLLSSFGKLTEEVSDASRRVELERLLAMLFQGRPSEVEVAVGKILAGEVSPDEARILINGLADAGSVEAQKGLVDLVNAGDLEMAAREASVHAFHTVQTPTAETIASLRQAMNDYSEPLRSTSLLALGRTSGNMERDATNEDPSAAAAAILEIIARFRSASDEGQKELALDALGNSGHSLALPVMLEVINGPPGNLRLVAIRGLRFMPAGTADELLQSLVQDESSEATRLAAVFAIGFRDQNLFAPLLIERFRLDGSADVGLAILRLLAPRVNMPVVREVIEWAGENSPHEAIRTGATDLLASAT